MTPAKMLQYPRSTKSVYHISMLMNFDDSPKCNSFVFQSPKLPKDKLIPFEQFVQTKISYSGSGLEYHICLKMISFGLI